MASKKQEKSKLKAMQNVKGRPDTHDCNETDYNGHFFLILNNFWKG